jgi:quercetin dioxygenase-like cupin family protein
MRGGDTAPVSPFGDLDGLTPLKVWDGVAARTVEGERATLAVIELDGGSVVPEHAHDNEQIGVCLAGSLRFRIGDETRELTSGSTWSILPNVPHEVHVGPDGCVVAEVFVPGRADWASLERDEPRSPRWPAA